jgi:hypothetical protein
MRGGGILALREAAMGGWKGKIIVIKMTTEAEVAKRK